MAAPSPSLMPPTNAGASLDPSMQRTRTPGSSPSAFGIYSVNTAAANNAALPGQMQQVAQNTAQVQGQQAAQAQAAQAGVTNAQDVRAGNQFMNMQAQNAQQLQQQANGQGPAAQAVQMQTNNAMQQGLAAQAALAGSVRGGNAGENARQAAMGQAQITAQAANQAQQNTLASEQQGISNLGQVTAAGQGEALQQAQMTQQGNQFNAGSANTAALQNAQMQTQNSQYNASNTQQQQQYADSLTAQYLQLGMSAEQAQSAANAQMAEFATNSGAQQQASRISGGAAGGNAAASTINAGSNAVEIGSGLVEAGGKAITQFSDERLKTDIGAADKDVSAFLDHLAAKSWTYKDPRYGAGKQVGVMAQDLEKSKLGKAMVSERQTPDGPRKMVDYGKGYAAIAASLDMLSRKLQAVEAKRG